MKKYGFGVDIGGTTVKIGLFETTGTLLDKWEIKTNTENNGESILPDIVASINAKMQEKGIAEDEVQGIGVSVPGPVFADGTVNRCVNLGWGVFNAKERMAELTPIRAEIGNDANSAALGEMWQGGAKGYKNVIMATLGTGVGAGVIVDGKIIAGSHGAGGELGHVCVNEEETDTCGCGKKGCLEQYTSANGITRMTKKRLAADDTPTKLRDLPEVNSKEIFDLAKAGDQVAMEQVEELGRILGKALASACCVVDPEIVVLGGGVSKAGQILIDVVEKNFKKYCFHACGSTKFALASLGNDAGMYGCVQLVLD